MKLSKTEIIIGILFILGVGIIFFAFLGNKENSNSPKHTIADQTNSSSQEKIIKKFLNSSDNELREIAENKKISLPPLTSLEKIDNSFREGKIDINKYLKLKVLAIFSPQDLPSNFQSQVYKKGEGDMILMEIREYQNQLDEKTKKMLLPFILLPEEKDSFFNPKTNRDAILNKIKQTL